MWTWQYRWLGLCPVWVADRVSHELKYPVYVMSARREVQVMRGHAGGSGPRSGSERRNREEA